MYEPAASSVAGDITVCFLHEGRMICVDATKRDRVAPHGVYTATCILVLELGFALGRATTWVPRIQ